MKNSLNFDLIERLNERITFLDERIKNRKEKNNGKLSSLELLDNNEDVILLNIFKDAKLIISLDKVSITDKEITAKAVNYLLQNVIDSNSFVVAVTIIKNYAKSYNIHNKKKIKVSLDDDLENNYVIKKQKLRG